MRTDPRPTRREVLARLGGGFGGLALGALFGADAQAAPHDLRPRSPHFAPRARAVIQLFMHGGPSHVDLLDPKPLLAKYDGKPPPAEVADDEKLTGNLLKSPYAFRNHGQSGLELREALPHPGARPHARAVLRALYTEQRNHEQAVDDAHRSDG